jgi:hypothetical protein
VATVEEEVVAVEAHRVVVLRDRLSDQRRKTSWT